MPIEPLRKLPEPLKKILRTLGSPFIPKTFAELSYWKSRYRAEGGSFGNSHYQSIMLAMAEEQDDRFLQGKIVADFGCGPRGSLIWAKSASLRLGIDILANRYADAFPRDVLSHDMVYLTSTERVIPCPSDFIDVMFSLNALDHVNSFETICQEILRVLKKGGLLIASFNLGEPATATEPQSLNEGRVNAALLDHLQIFSCRKANKGPRGDVYRPIMSGHSSYDPERPGFLWVKARKPG